MRRELERIEIPGEHEARERAWALVQAAYREREPTPRPRPFRRPLAVACGAAALVAAAVSPPGRAVIDNVREAIGVDSAQEALFGVPAGGRMLVTSDAGAWVVQADGSTRLLGDYDEAAWSPFGSFVAGARRNELAALEPDGDVRWKLARPRVRAPSWTGSRTNTRIAYVTDSRLHVVAGDGTRDVDAGGMPAPARVEPVWRPGPRFEVAFVDVRGDVHAFAVEEPGISWRAPGLRDARQLAWAPDGSRLIVVGRNRLVTLRGPDGRTRAEPVPGVRAVAFSPSGRLAVVRSRAGRSDLVVDGRVRFSGTGTFRDPTWSPDGRWIVVSWPEADQWLFVRASGTRRVRAVANVSRQFDSATPPRIEGWCCP